MNPLLHQYGDIVFLTKKQVFDQICSGSCEEDILTLKSAIRFIDPLDYHSTFVNVVNELSAGMNVGQKFIVIKTLAEANLTNYISFKETVNALSRRKSLSKKMEIIVHLCDYATNYTPSFVKIVNTTAFETKMDIIDIIHLFSYSENVAKQATLIILK